MDMTTAPEGLIEAGEDEDLVEELLAATNSPLEFVSLAFPTITLESWQRQVLQTIGTQLQENAQLNRWKAVQLALPAVTG
jgi:hypothetical protein